MQNPKTGLNEQVLVALGKNRTSEAFFETRRCEATYKGTAVFEPCSKRVILFSPHRNPMRPSTSAYTTTLLLLLGVIVTASAASDDLLKSKASLEIVDAYSSVSMELLSIPTVAFSLIQGINGGGLRSDVIPGTNIVIHGYEGGAAIGDGIATVAVTQKFDSTGFTTVSVLKSAQGESTPNTAISPVADRPWIVRSRRRDTLYDLMLYAYDTTTGVIEEPPRCIFDLATVHPKAFTAARNALGSIGFSSDGKYIFYTGAIYDTNSSVATDQINGVLRVSDDGSTITEEGHYIVERPSTGDGLFYPQPNVVMYPDRQSGDDFYTIVVPLDHYKPGTTGYNAKESLLVSMRYYPDTWEFLQTGRVSIPQFVQGFDISPDKKDVILFTNSMGPLGVSIEQLPVESYNVSLPGAYEELRMYKFNPKRTQNALEYRSSENADLFGFQVRYSHDGKYVATSGAAQLFINVPIPIPGVNRFFPTVGPSMICVYKVVGNKLDKQDCAPAGPIVLNLAWTDDDDGLFTCGIPTIDRADIQYLSVRKT
jgi:hypothetical protein